MRVYTVCMCIITIFYLVFTGVISGPIVARLGCRYVAVFGVLLCTLGNLLSAFCTEPITFMLTFGLMAGMANTCINYGNRFWKSYTCIFSLAC